MSPSLSYYFCLIFQGILNFNLECFVRSPLIAPAYCQLLIWGSPVSPTLILFFFSNFTPWWSQSSLMTFNSSASIKIYIFSYYLFSLNSRPICHTAYSTSLCRCPRCIKLTCTYLNYLIFYPQTLLTHCYGLNCVPAPHTLLTPIQM